MITTKFSKLFQECVLIVISFTQNSYPLDVNQCPHQTTQYDVVCVCVCGVVCVCDVCMWCFFID